jgi:hypothetical protein
MTLVGLASVVMLWSGMTLVLSEMRWFRRRRLQARLAPYLPGGPTSRLGVNTSAFGAVRHVVLPIVHDLGSRLSSALGVTDDLQLRFDRVHASLSVSQFRSRQLGSSVAAFAGAAFIVVSVQPPPALVP